MEKGGPYSINRSGGGKKKSPRRHKKRRRKSLSINSLRIALNTGGTFKQGESPSPLYKFGTGHRKGHGEFSISKHLRLNQYKGLGGVEKSLIQKRRGTRGHVKTRQSFAASMKSEARGKRRNHRDAPLRRRRMRSLEATRGLQGAEGPSRAWVGKAYERNKSRVGVPLMGQRPKNRNLTPMD